MVRHFRFLDVTIISGQFGLQVDMIILLFFFNNADSYSKVVHIILQFYLSRCFLLASFCKQVFFSNKQKRLYGDQLSNSAFN